MKKFLRQFVPFLLGGVLVVAFAFGILLLAYLLLFGALVGIVLFTIVWIRNKFFPRKTPIKRNPSSRIIDADHWKKM